jgi:hypothetical protein
MFSEVAAMRLAIIGVLASLSFVLSALPVWAQGPPPGKPSEITNEMQMELRRKRLIVRPPTDPQAVTRDAERALAESAARERNEALTNDVTRDVTHPYWRRPDTDPAVVQGIQQKNLGKIGR